MDAGVVAVVALVVFAWGLFSDRLARADLSAPIVFVTAGLLLSGGVRIADGSFPQEAIRLLAEVTLVWVLFADAARVGLRELRTELGLYGRLLAIGLPLTLTAGTLLAMWMFTGMSGWLALLVGAALAPTDAALGASVMSNPAVPARIRRVLNVESGLNDGIVTPVVTLAIVGAAAAESAHSAPSLTSALVDLLIGAAVGIVLGVVGGRAMRAALRRGWASPSFAGPGVLALALGAYALALWLDANGFVAAFIAGLSFGNAAGRGEEKEVLFVEQTAGLVSLVTWLIFGAIAVPVVFDRADWQIVLYAVLSLTVIRMVPVALCLIGSGLPLRTVAFVGWFGPRGLASVIFALIAVEELHTDADKAVSVIGMTVLLSVFLHGLSATPLAKRYGARETEIPPAPAQPELPVRGLVPKAVETVEG